MRTGKMGFGNKGAVMVRMRVFDEPMAAMCAHLASGEGPADALKRQADFMQICRTGAFGAAADDGQTILHAPLDTDPTYARSHPVRLAAVVLDRPWAPGVAAVHARVSCMCERGPACRQGEWTRSPLAAKQPAVFFLGDLNFRLRMTDAEVRAQLRRGALDRLLARDELMAAMRGGDGVFAGWREGVVTFPPTFKYVKGMERYVGDPVDGAPLHAYETCVPLPASTVTEALLSVCHGPTDIPRCCPRPYHPHNRLTPSVCGHGQT